MFQIVGDSKNIPQDAAAFIETLAAEANLFDGQAEICIARAPGRLDVMGGIADYSGALVLEMPIAEAAFAAVQKRDVRTLKIVSANAAENNRTHFFAMALDEFETDGNPISYSAAREKFRRDAANSWAAYMAGAFLVLMREKNVRFECGAAILIDSKVPEGKGVSSSAATEVATMSAIAAAFDIEIALRELAILCQKVENLVVGAPCGIMDQMASAIGEENRLLAMVCQPAQVLGTRHIPDEAAFWGIDSGIRHSVGAGDYGSVRTGAFIGYRIIAEIAGLQISRTETAGVVEIADEKWNGYLANIAPAEFEKYYAAQLPREISGAEFLRRFQGITDTVTDIAPEKNYAVYHPTAHPIYENARVRQFAELLENEMTNENLSALGDLMNQSHRSYSACGLGTDGTDLLIELVKREKNLFGAKITGGGSGGTAAVLGKKNAEAEAEIERVAAEYERQTGHRPHVFKGSSPGAAAFGVLRIKKA